jgi:hypothetical protein
MMNILMMVLFGLLVSLGIPHTCQAQDIAVSVTIPAIPGVNCPPLIVQDNVKTMAANTSQNVSTVKTEKQENTPMLLQEESQKQVRFANNQSTQVVRTIYSR